MSRLSVVDQMYYQPETGRPLAVVSRFGIDLPASCPPPVERSFVVSGDWVPLPGDWPAVVAALALQLPAVRRQVMPTPDELRDELASSVVVGVASGLGVPVVPFMTVAPGRSCRLAETNVKLLRVRAAGPPVTLTATAFSG